MFCTINMHLLLHVADQVHRYGALPYCAMFSFEHQFFNFKTLHNATSSVLQQICEKTMLCKRGKSFLSLSNFQEKNKILNIVNPSALSSKIVYVDEGQIKCKNRRYLSRAYTRRSSSHLTTVYEISSYKGYRFVDAIRFKQCDDKTFVEVEYLKIRDELLLLFEHHNLSNVPEDVIHVMKEQDFFYFCFVLSCVRHSTV